MIIDNEELLIEYLKSKYLNSRKKELAVWITGEDSMAFGVYEGEELTQGILVYFDENREKWILLDNFHADLSVRSYIEYRQEFDKAIVLFKLYDVMNEEEKEEVFFFQDLD